MSDNSLYCPYCGSRVIKSGKAYGKEGELQRYECKDERNAKCGKFTIKPISEQGAKELIASE